MSLRITDEEMALIGTPRSHATVRRTKTVADEYADAIDQSVISEARTEARIASLMVVAAISAERTLIERGTITGHSPETFLNIYTAICTVVDEVLAEIKLSGGADGRAIFMNMVVNACAVGVVKRFIALNAR